ncbi:methyltransferase domain-containing protein [Streptomyces sp. NPDC003077]|uniref:SAM-dependent methyltransferase n=1 Tax=Streptomyces sp. NPDC003077 TaxID=3154443 RepID=UPI0033A56485
MVAEVSWRGNFSHKEIESTYEMFTALEEGAAGPDRHYGIWSGPEDPTPVEEATGRLTDLVIGRLGVGAGSRVLDVGCGNGRPATRIAQLTGANVVGIDIDRRALRTATAYAERQGVGDAVRFEYADALHPPFEDAAFDAALAFESTPHFAVAELYGALARVLRPGGRLVVETPYVRGRATADVLERIGPYLRLVNAVSLDPPHTHLSVARRAGLEITELLDITEQVHGSFGRLLDRLHALRDRLAAALGEERADHLLAAFAGWARAEEVGGVIMTFTRAEN